MTHGHQPLLSNIRIMTDQRQIGPFLLEGQLGVGGMGIVYLATYTVNGKKVALKVLSPALSSDKKLLSRFEREIDILKRLDHPNIVKYYGGGTQNRQRYYAMQYIDGGSMLDVLKKRKRLTWEQSIHLGRQLCSALEHAHNAGIIHRDLKPANLFLTRKGRLKLGDFGIAKDTEATALTMAGKTVGTYAYMAPEQIQGTHPISRKTDIYALGCLLYEVLTGETPFTADNPAEMLLQHLNSDPYNVSEKAIDCPVWLDQLIERMLAKNPDDRPFDALAVHTELGEIRDKIAAGNCVSAQTSVGTKTAAKPEDVATRKSLKRRRKKPANSQTPFHEQTWFLASCLVLLIALTTWLMWPHSEQWYYEQARAGMDSQDVVEHRTALERYILPALEKFPEGEHSSEFRIWKDTIAVDVLDRQMEKKVKGFGEIDGVFESSYAIARKAELNPEASPLEAIERYSAFLVEHRNSDEASETDDKAPWIRLFDRRLTQAMTKFTADPRMREIIRRRLLTAESLIEDGKEDEARIIWEHTWRLFGDVAKDFSTHARRRLNGESSVLPATEILSSDTAGKER